MLKKNEMLEKNAYLIATDWFMRSSTCDTKLQELTTQLQEKDKQLREISLELQRYKLLKNKVDFQLPMILKDPAIQHNNSNAATTVKVLVTNLIANLQQIFPEQQPPAVNEVSKAEVEKKSEQPKPADNDKQADELTADDLKHLWWRARHSGF
jgi:hypothetical protein